jgi:hypothetical protein
MLNFPEIHLRSVLKHRMHQTSLHIAFGSDLACSTASLPPENHPSLARWAATILPCSLARRVRRPR